MEDRKRSITQRCDLIQRNLILERKINLEKRGFIGINHHLNDSVGFDPRNQAMQAGIWSSGGGVSVI
jgi:hypothetical protein